MSCSAGGHLQCLLSMCGCSKGAAHCCCDLLPSHLQTYDADRWLCCWLSLEQPLGVSCALLSRTPTTPSPVSTSILLGTERCLCCCWLPSMRLQVSCWVRTSANTFCSSSVVSPATCFSSTGVHSDCRATRDSASPTCTVQHRNCRICHSTIKHTAQVKGLLQIIQPVRMILLLRACPWPALNAGCDVLQLLVNAGTCRSRFSQPRLTFSMTVPGLSC
jgi:hypothetical protein